MLVVHGAIVATADGKSVTRGNAVNVHKIVVHPAISAAAVTRQTVTVPVRVLTFPTRNDPQTQNMQL